MNDSRLYYVGLNLVKGIGAARTRLLLDVFGDLKSAWNAPVETLVKAGISQKIAQSIHVARDQIKLDEYLRRIENSGIKVITWEDVDYPARLKELDQPPPVLFLRGQIKEEDNLAVAIVGTRRMTTYGRQICEEISHTLAANGVTIVSGLARGIDAIAHESAVNVGGRTLAVLGSGVDRIYPPEHSRLSGKIEANGAVISDYAPGTPPDSANFPPRNRIISGLSKAVIVIEAGENSGSLITAAFAIEQGREVFAVPGPIHAPQSRGTNRLIQQGTRLLMSAGEILDYIQLTQSNRSLSTEKQLPMDTTESLLYSMLSQDPQYIDDLAIAANLPIEKVSATLILLELKGLARQVGGMQYVSIRENQEPYD